MENTLFRNRGDMLLLQIKITAVKKNDDQRGKDTFKFINIKIVMPI